MLTQGKFFMRTIKCSRYLPRSVRTEALPALVGPAVTRVLHGGLVRHAFGASEAEVNASAAIGPEGAITSNVTITTAAQ